MKNNVCPQCGANPQKQLVTEHCNLSSPDAQPNLKASCIKPIELETFLRHQDAKREPVNNTISIEDPCMNCTHNIITEQPGTFIDIKTVFYKTGGFKFVETHECHQCGTIYKFANKKETIH